MTGKKVELLVIIVTLWEQLVIIVTLSERLVGSLLCRNDWLYCYFVGSIGYVVMLWELLVTLLLCWNYRLYCHFRWNDWRCSVTSLERLAMLSLRRNDWLYCYFVGTIG